MSSSQGSSSSVRLRYVRGLDGLRAIAVAVVVIFHATDTALRGGFLGVDVFFVLSGYLITSQLLAEWQRRGQISIPAFWKRRARRILAALYLLLFCTLAFALLVHPDEVAVFRGDVVAALAYVANWYFIFHHQPYFEVVAHPSPLIHLWSLGVEEQFYLFWPLLLVAGLLFLRRWTPLAILIAASASCALMAILYRPGVDPSRLYYGTDTHASGLLIGSLLAFFWTPWRDAATPGRASRLWSRIEDRVPGSLLVDALGVVVLLALAYFFLRTNDSSAFLYRGGFTLVAIVTAAGVVLFSAPRARLVVAVLEWPPVRWVGRRSYSIYLWHWPVIVFTRPGIDLPLSAFPLFALRVGASLLLAELSFRFVEEPIRRGDLARLWRWLRRAFVDRQWWWLGLAWGTGALGAALVAVLGLAAAEAKVPPPPTYLAVTSVDTIILPSATAIAASGGSPPATPSATATAAPAASSPAPALASRAVAPSTTPTSSPAPESDTPAPASAPPAPTPPATPVSAGRVIAIGDSVMLGAVPQLAQSIDGIEVNAAVSRQVSTGIQLLRQLHDASALGQVVVVGLGSNGAFTGDEFSQLMTMLADVPRVVFINNKVPRSWQDGNNSVIINGVRRYPNTRLVDWYGASLNHPEYFQTDQYHLRAEGAAAYSALVASAVGGP